MTFKLTLIIDLLRDWNMLAGSFGSLIFNVCDCFLTVSKNHFNGNENCPNDSDDDTCVSYLLLLRGFLHWICYSFSLDASYSTQKVAGKGSATVCKVCKNVWEGWKRFVLCSLYLFQIAIKLHSLNRFTWFKNTDQLIITTKGSGPSKYLEIGPNFGLKEHYYLKPGGIFFPIGSDYYGNRNSFI